MTAYCVFGLQEVTDPAGLGAYRAAAGPTYADRGAKVIAGPGVAATLEGEPLLGVIVMEFPSVAEAQDWYASPAYQAAAQLRWGASKCFALILEARA